MSLLKLCPIADLLTEEFFVPSYQRGYRWTPKEVIALLDDLEHFLASDPPRDSYYCLQPIVVRRRNDGAWEVIDGQQRLTTISLLLGCLAEVAKLLGKQRFRLSYESRLDSEAFLANPIGDAVNIDFYHMRQAYEAIHAWFEARDGVVRVDMIKCLTQPNESGANTRVIWYELAADQNPRAVFLRLNVGRIPLTNAELIRALLLRSDNGAIAVRQQQIAYEWDIIEKRLQEPSYWYFLHSGVEGPVTRIEFLFTVYCQLHAPELARRPDELATFFAFQQLLSPEPFETWLRFRKDVAQVLEEWFEDRTLYHLVGALVAAASASGGTGGPGSAGLLVELLETREGKTGAEFERELRARLWRSFMGRAQVKMPSDLASLEDDLDEHLEQLRYGGASVGLRTALLIFNVAGLLAHPRSTSRFGFEAFKLGRWDIEHIRSVAEYMPNSPAHRRDWLGHARSFVVAQGDRALLATIDEELAHTRGPEAFEQVFRAVRALSGEGEAEDADALSNLALLDMETNRSYKNAIFPVKRARIINLDSEGVYLLPATRNVFLKYYSPEAKDVFRWSGEDQAAYGHAQRETLLSFFRPMLEGAS